MGVFQALREDIIPSSTGILLFLCLPTHCPKSHIKYIKLPVFVQNDFLNASLHCTVNVTTNLTIQKTELGWYSRAQVTNRNW